MLHPPTFLLLIITLPAVSAEQDSRSLFNHFYLVQTRLLQSDLKCWCWVSYRNLSTRKDVRIKSANQYILSYAYKSVCLEDPTRTWICVSIETYVGRETIPYNFHLMSFKCSTFTVFVQQKWNIIFITG